MNGMSKEDCTELSQLVGAVKRARSTIKSSSSQIFRISSHYAGTATEQLNAAGIKCLFQAEYWLNQAIDVLGLSLEKSRKSLEVK